MASAVKTLFALCALLAGISADRQCTTKTYGDTSGRPVYLTVDPLTPPTKTWDIQFDASAACYPARAAGVVVRACDPEGPPPPSVNILSLYEAIVTRNTYAIYTTADLYVTVFCQPSIRGVVGVGGVGGIGGVGVVRGVGGVGGVGRVGGVGGVGGIRGVGEVGGVGGVGGLGGVRGVGGVRGEGGVGVYGRVVPTAVPLL